MGKQPKFNLGTTDFEFVDFELNDHTSFAEVLNRQFGFNSRSIQLSRGANRTRLVMLGSDREGIAASWCRISQSQYIEFELPEGALLISTSRSSQPYHCNGLRIGPTLMTLYPGGQVYRGFYPQGWDAVDILVKESSVAEHDLLAPAVLQQLAAGRLLISGRGGDAATRLFEDLYLLIRDAGLGNDEVFRQAVASRVVQTVLERLRPVTDSEILPELGRDLEETRRADLLMRAIDFIGTHPHAEITAKQLAERLDVTYRLLHYAFRDALGISPYQFMLTLRMHALRDTLKEGGVSVRDACYAHGFYTLSRARRQYRRLFGELPGETLRNGIQ